MIDDKFQISRFVEVELLNAEEADPWSGSTTMRVPAPSLNSRGLTFNALGAAAAKVQCYG